MSRGVKFVRQPFDRRAAFDAMRASIHAFTELVARDRGPPEAEIPATVFACLLSQQLASAPSLLCPPQRVPLMQLMAIAIESR